MILFWLEILSLLSLISQSAKLFKKIHMHWTHNILRLINIICIWFSQEMREGLTEKKILHDQQNQAELHLHCTGNILIDMCQCLTSTSVWLDEFWKNSPVAVACVILQSNGCSQPCFSHFFLLSPFACPHTSHFTLPHCIQVQEQPHQTVLHQEHGDSTHP